MLPSRFKSPYQPPQGSYSLVSATCQLQSPVTRPPITPCRRDQVVSAGRNPLLGDDTDRFTWADRILCKATIAQADRVREWLLELAGGGLRVEVQEVLVAWLSPGIGFHIVHNAMMSAAD